MRPTGTSTILACFVRPGEVCLTWTDRRRDPQHAISLDAWERLLKRAMLAGGGSRCGACRCQVRSTLSCP